MKNVKCKKKILELQGLHVLKYILEYLRFFCSSMIPDLHQLVLIEVPQLWVLLRAVGVHRGVLVAATFGTV